MSGRRLNRRLIVATVLVVLPAVPLTWLLRDLVRERVVDPIAYYLWFGELIVRSWPQERVWNALVLIALLNVVLLIGRELLKFRNRPEVPAAAPGSVAAWLESLQIASHGGFLQKMLIYKIRSLLVKTLAYRGQHPLREIWTQLHLGTLPLAPELQDYLRDGQEGEVGRQGSRACPEPAEGGAGERLVSLLFSRSAVVEVSGELPQVEAIVHFLEAYLEDIHDP